MATILLESDAGVSVFLTEDPPLSPDGRVWLCHANVGTARGFRARVDLTPEQAADVLRGKLTARYPEGSEQHVAGLHMLRRWLCGE